VHPTYHGGFALALNEMLKSSVTLGFAGASGMKMTTEGVMAMRYQRQKEGAPGASVKMGRSSVKRQRAKNKRIGSIGTF